MLVARRFTIFTEMIIVAFQLHHVELRVHNLPEVHLAIPWDYRQLLEELCTRLSSVQREMQSLLVCLGQAHPLLFPMIKDQL